MQSYVYSIIIDCVYYDVGNETTTEIIIVVERIKGAFHGTFFFTALLLYVRKMKKNYQVRACFISMMRVKIRTNC